MNDDELDRMVARTAPITDGQVTSLDLRDAEIDLMEEIMATTTRETTRELGRLGETGPPKLRHIGVRIGVRAAVAATAAAAAAAAVLTVHGLGGGDTGTDLDGDLAAYEVVDVPRLIPGDVPAGLAVSTVAEHGLIGPAEETVLYGHAPAAGLPVVDLTLWWTHGQEDMTMGPSGPDFRPVQVHGKSGHACSGAECAVLGPGVRSGVEWTERPGMVVELASPSLTVEQLTAVADGLTIDGDDVALGTVPDDLPAPLDELARRHVGEPGVVTELRIDGQGHIVGDLPPRDFVNLWYRLADPTGWLRMTIEPGDEVDLAQRLAAGLAEPIADVRGHPAWSITLPPGPGGWDVERRSILWQEAPGVLVTLETGGTSYDLGVLRDVAGSLRPASDAEWQAIVDQGG